MNMSDEVIREQLSAWMDGELPAEEARFLERRLANDPDLRRQFERLQLVSACLKGQALRPMPAILASAIGNGLESPVISTPTAKRGVLLGWAVAASVAMLALFIAPGILRDRPSGQGSDMALVPAAVPGNLVASPASADLVATAESAAVSVPVARRESLTATTSTLLAMGSDPPRQESPLPLESQSPTDFPLAEASVQKAWPRSPLATGRDPAMEAYLVRHNQMMTNDGLGGFMPYVDVVANDQDEVGVVGVEEAGR